MKRPVFEDVLKIINGFSGGKALCLLWQFKFPTKCLGYFTGHHWGVVVITRKDYFCSGELLYDR
jgi:hypothetical protein